MIAEQVDALEEARLLQISIWKVIGSRKLTDLCSYRPRTKQGREIEAVSKKGMKQKPNNKTEKCKPGTDSTATIRHRASDLVRQLCDLTAQFNDLDWRSLPLHQQREFATRLSRGCLPALKIMNMASPKGPQDPLVQMSNAFLEVLIRHAEEGSDYAARALWTSANRTANCVRELAERSPERLTRAAAHSFYFPWLRSNVGDDSPDFEQVAAKVSFSTAWGKKLKGKVQMDRPATRVVAQLLETISYYRSNAEVLDDPLMPPYYRNFTTLPELSRATADFWWKIGIEPMLADPAIRRWIQSSNFYTKLIGSRPMAPYDIVAKIRDRCRSALVNIANSVSPRTPP